MYILFNKPYGVLSQFTPDIPGQRTLAEFGLPEGVYAAGRLDADSEGLLLLTDDGALIHNLLEPGRMMERSRSTAATIVSDAPRGHERTYLVQVEGIPTPESLDQLECGVLIRDYRTLPAKVKLLSKEPDVPERIPPIRERKSVPVSWIELTLNEGKNRQVRKMTAAVGHPTLRLIRISFGSGLTLSGLTEGKWRTLRPEEVRELRKIANERLSELKLKKKAPHG